MPSPQVSPDDISPAAAPPAAESAEPAPKKADSGGSELPDELLEAAPALQLLLNGSPPATFAPKEAEFPELKTVAKHIKDLGKAGFGVYASKDGNNVVVFNGLYVTPDQIKAADESGQLESVAAPYSELRTALEGGNSEAGATEASPDAPTASQTAGTPASAATKEKLTTARVTNLSVGAPTSGPVPGQGRILSSIVKPVV